MLIAHPRLRLPLIAAFAFAVTLAFSLTASNALAADPVTVERSEATVRFPQDIDYTISLDQTLPVTEGLKEITETLVIAIVLVIFVVYLFLQDW